MPDILDPQDPSYTPTSSGGNKWIDTLIRANPDALARFGEALLKPTPQEAWKHISGEDFPMLRKVEHQDFVKMWGEGRSKLMEHALSQFTDPTYGASVGEGARVLGEPLEKFAHPSQRRNVLDTSFIGPMPPVRTDVQPGQGFSPSELATPSVGSQSLGDLLQKQMNERGEPFYTEGPRPERSVLDPNAPMNTMQRAEVAAKLKRESTWPRYMGGGDPAQLRIIKAALNARGLVEGTPEYNAALASMATDVAVHKRIAPEGSPEEQLTKARAGLTEVRGQREQVALQHDEEMFDLKRRNIESQIFARTKNAEQARQVSQSLIDLRKSQIALNQAREAGTLPEHLLRVAHEANMEEHRRAVFAYLGTWDKNDLFKGPGRQAAAQDLMDYMGLSYEAAQSYLTLFEKLQGMVTGEEPTVTREKRPTVGGLEKGLPSKRPPGTQPPGEVQPEAQRKRQLKSSKEALDELQRAMDMAVKQKMPPGTRYEATDGTVYTWDGKEFKK